MIFLAQSGCVTFWCRQVVCVFFFCAGRLHDYFVWKGCVIFFVRRGCVIFFLCGEVARSYFCAEMLHDFLLCGEVA